MVWKLEICFVLGSVNWLQGEELQPNRYRVNKCVSIGLVHGRYIKAWSVDMRTFTLELYVRLMASLSPLFCKTWRRDQSSCRHNQKIEYFDMRQEWTIKLFPSDTKCSTFRNNTDAIVSLHRWAPFKKYSMFNTRPELSNSYNAFMCIRLAKQNIYQVKGWRKFLQHHASSPPAISTFEFTKPKILCNYSEHKCTTLDVAHERANSWTTTAIKMLMH